MSQLSLQAASADEQITVSMASIPCRMEGMLNTVRALLPACDNFDIYLNNYPKGFSVPEFDDPKVTAFRGEDLGARGKMYMAHRTPGYFFTVDDDLNYPADYIYKLIQAIEKYQRQAVVGIHGTLFTLPTDPVQPPTRMLFSHAVYQGQDVPVHTLGTGVMAYHSDTIMFNWRHMEPGKIDDQTAWTAQEARIPMLSVEHPDAWVTENKDLIYRGSLRRNTAASERAVQRVNERQWQLYLPDCWKELEEIP